MVSTSVSAPNSPSTTAPTALDRYYGDDLGLRLSILSPHPSIPAQSRRPTSTREQVLGIIEVTVGIETIGPLPFCGQYSNRFPPSWETREISRELPAPFTLVTSRSFGYGRCVLASAEARCRTASSASRSGVVVACGSACCCGCWRSACGSPRPCAISFRHR